MLQNFLKIIIKIKFEKRISKIWEKIMKKKIEKWQGNFVTFLIIKKYRKIK